MGSWPRNRFTAGQPVDTDIEKTADEGAKQRNDQIDRKHDLMLNHAWDMDASVMLFSVVTGSLLIQKPCGAEDPPFTFTNDHFYNSLEIRLSGAGGIPSTPSIPEWPVSQRRTDQHGKSSWEAAGSEISSRP